MDADTDHSGHERVMLFCMDHHAVQAIIIQDSAVDPLRCCPLVINPFISFCPAWDLCVVERHAICSSFKQINLSRKPWGSSTVNASFLLILLCMKFS